MATVTMPVFSMYAKGTLGKQLTYRMQHKKFCVNYHQRIPKEWSEKQKIIRLNFTRQLRLRNLIWKYNIIRIPSTIKPGKYFIPEV